MFSPFTLVTYENIPIICVVMERLWILSIDQIAKIYYRHISADVKIHLAVIITRCIFFVHYLPVEHAQVSWLCNSVTAFRVHVKTKLNQRDDVIKWKHFPRNWPFVRGIHRSPVNSPHKGQWRGALMFSLICVWINDWANDREAGDLRRYRGHYDVTVMKMTLILTSLHVSLTFCHGYGTQWFPCS